MDANAASQIISRAEGGDATTSTVESGGSPTAAMDAAMYGGGSSATQSGPTPVTVSLDAGMMTGDSSGEDQPAPKGYDSDTEDVKSTTDAAPVKEASSDHS